LGQNFLKHEGVAKEIVEEAGVTDRDLVVEIGAGSGMLTRACPPGRARRWPLNATRTGPPA
jgi:16S rRNA A1518/A1519 N6-dimethyltransferase RsmA/KsgA/DIM1 with predicted DNA glycosylase/AP lyase activity